MTPVNITAHVVQQIHGRVTVREVSGRVLWLSWEIAWEKVKGQKEYNA
jgi:hypothetical protein